MSTLGGFSTDIPDWVKPIRIDSDWFRSGFPKEGSSFDEIDWHPKKPRHVKKPKKKPKPKGPSQKELKKMAKTGEKLDIAREEFRDRKFFRAEAALNRYLSNVGGTETHPTDFIRSFYQVTDAEETIIGDFQNDLIKSAIKLKFGKTEIYDEYFDRPSSSFNPMSELTVLAGKSMLHSRGMFRLWRIENTIYIEGRINHKWWDDYNFDTKLGVIKNIMMYRGKTYLHEKEMQELEKWNRAKPFVNEAKWSHHLRGKLELRSITNMKANVGTFDWKYHGAW